jgi:hypothetical protein
MVIIFVYLLSLLSLNKNSNIMVQHCVNAASTDFGPYNSKKQRDAADVVGR